MFSIPSFSHLSLEAGALSPEAVYSFHVQFNEKKIILWPFQKQGKTKIARKCKTKYFLVVGYCLS